MALLAMSGVTKAFPGVVALDAVDFELSAGEVRALMGENGAGKSTLVKILAGVYQPDSGIVALHGAPVRPRSPVHAQELGMSTVFQEVNLAPNLSVAENVCLGTEPRALGRIKWGEVRARASNALERMKIDIDVDAPLGEYSTAVQQLVAIARAVDRDARVLVLDEPTSSLDRDEVQRLFDLVRQLQADGMGIVFITHFLDQVYAIADSVTVLRNGRKVGDWEMKDLPRQRLVEEMLGKELGEVPQVERGRSSVRDVRVSVRDLGRKRVIEPLTFDVRHGETLGLSGLLGSGRTEALKLMFGAVAADSGTVSAHGRQGRPRSPRHAVRAGFGLCPEDRRAEGICPGLSVAENMLLVVQARRGWIRPISRRRAAQIVAEQVRALQIATPDPGRPIEHLSGGNQQKVLLSRWLVAEPEVLLLDEPTRGIDVGSKLEIRRLITGLARKGMSFLFTSAELEEVVHTCDRVVVLRDRRMVGELDGDQVTEQNVMARIAEGDQ